MKKWDKKKVCRTLLYGLGGLVGLIILFYIVLLFI